MHSISKRLNKQKLSEIVSRVTWDVEYVRDRYMRSGSKQRELITKNIETDYIMMCEFVERLMPIDEYISDHDEGTGWEWITDSSLKCPF